MKIRMVRVRRRLPIGRVLLLMAATCAAYACLMLLRGDPVQEMLDRQQEKRVRQSVSFEGMQLYAVRTAVCNSQQTARIEAARYIARGAAGYVMHRDMWHVLCAGYETQVQAESVCSRLSGEEDMACDVLGLIADGVSFYLTATPTQADALISCEERLRETEVLLGAISLSLDGGEIGRGQVTAALDEQSGLLKQAASELEQAAGEEDHAVCAPLIELADKALDRLDALCEAGDELKDVLFSGRLKEAFLHLRIEHILWLETLGG